MVACYFPLKTKNPHLKFRTNFATALTLILKYKVLNFKSSILKSTVSTLKITLFTLKATLIRKASVLTFIFRDPLSLILKDKIYSNDLHTTTNKPVRISKFRCPDYLH